MSLYGILEKLPVLGVFACSSIVFSAAYTIYMFNRISFGGSFTKFLEESIYDVNKREFIIIIYISIIYSNIRYISFFNFKRIRLFYE